MTKELPEDYTFNNVLGAMRFFSTIEIAMLVNMTVFFFTGLHIGTLLAGAIFFITEYFYRKTDKSFVEFFGTKYHIGQDMKGVFSR